MSLAGTTTMTKRNKRPEPEATQEQDMKYAEEELTPVPKSKHKKDGKEEFPDSVVKTEDAQTPPQSMRPWLGAKIPDKNRTIYMSIESPARGMHPSEIDSAWRLDFRDDCGGNTPQP